MKNIIILVQLCFLTQVHSQNECGDFYVGSFTMDVGASEIVIERSGMWQYEASDEYGIEYLNKIEKADDCSYYLYRYKVIKEGILPKPNMTEKALVEIVKIEKNDFYFRSKIIGKESWLEGKITKVSNEISEKFESLIAKYDK
ncbi:hypothetical protein [Winogradskyella luteola]|uniref:Uncharacterized protein n=1 Tax=Winogradskyella luteola TaxID=2828330 RepID=A0A9X1JN59_9FLAO|nr:hypothetical protein [Winogradskyella luteola]MBV7269215.1 hypothetical protein [Winogradskyella luteola]